MATSIIAAKWFGSFEGYAACASGLFGLMLLTYPDAATSTSHVMDDYAWAGRWLALPFLLKAGATGTGLILNELHHRTADSVRFSGAIIGCMLWVSLSVSSFVNGIFSFGFWFVLVALFFSVRLMSATWPTSSAAAHETV